MSAIPPGAVLAGLDLSGFATSLQGQAIGRRYDTGVTRVIDPEGSQLNAEVTVEESHDDTLEITQHPVEYGAAITDHAYRHPSEVRLRVGWSDAYVGGHSGAAKDIYTQILALQYSRRPFSITTGKRQYKNMLIAELRTETNSGTEYSFVADVTFREILLVGTVTISGGAPSADEVNLAKPEANAPTGDGPTHQTKPASLTPKQVSDGGGTGVISGPFDAPSQPLGTVSYPVNTTPPPGTNPPPTEEAGMGGAPA